MKKIVKKIVSTLPYWAQRQIYTAWFYVYNISTVLRPVLQVGQLPVPKDAGDIRLIGFLKTYNEVASGNLERTLRHMKKFCDDIVVCDCESTDNSLDIIKKYTDHVIVEPNEFKRELFTKQKMLEYTLKLKPDWIVWIDADEVFDRDGESGDIRKLCSYGDENGIDGFLFREYNLWLSTSDYRVDELWGQVRKVNLWKNNGHLHFDLKEGLHRPQYPFGLSRIEPVSTKLIHYGFASPKAIADKYAQYKKWGQAGYLLERQVNNKSVRLRPFNPEWFPVSVSGR